MGDCDGGYAYGDIKKKYTNFKSVYFLSVWKRLNYPSDMVYLYGKL